MPKSPSDSSVVQNIKLVAKTGTHRRHNVNLSAIFQKLLTAILNKLSSFEIELERLSRKPIHSPRKHDERTISSLEMKSNCKLNETHSLFFVYVHITKENTSSQELCTLRIIVK